MKLPTAEEIRLIILDLDKARDAANCHTVNKACMYLKLFSGRQPSPVRLRAIYDEANKALKSGEWKGLTSVLRGLW